MRRFWLLVTLGLSAACGGWRSDPCALSAGEPSLPLSAYAVVGEASTILVPLGPLAFCSTPRSLTATAELVDPAGRKTSPTVTASLVERSNPRSTAWQYEATFEFTPDAPGLWTLDVHWSNGFQQTTTVLVATPLTTASAPVRRTYVDRVDYCDTGGPYLSGSGLMFCARGDDNVWVYGLSGQILTHFTGRGLQVSGNDIWSGVNADLEHRTDVGGTVRSDGAVTGPYAVARGDVRDGRLQRELADAGVITLTWDGSALTEQRSSARVLPGSTTFVLQDGAAWNQDGCFARQGCQQTDCGFVRVCGVPGTTNTLDPDAAFAAVTSVNGAILDGAVITEVWMRPRPFTVDGPVAYLAFVQRIVPTASGSFELAWSGLGAPDKAAVVTPGHVLLPRRVADAIGFDAVRRSGGRVVGLTDDWLLELADPFTLVVTKLR